MHLGKLLRKRINKSTILQTNKVNGKNCNDVLQHNPYEILYVDDTSEQ